MLVTKLKFTLHGCTKYKVCTADLICDLFCSGFTFQYAISVYQECHPQVVVIASFAAPPYLRLDLLFVFFWSRFPCYKWSSYFWHPLRCSYHITFLFLFCVKQFLTYSSALLYWCSECVLTSILCNSSYCIHFMRLKFHFPVSCTSVPVC